MEDNVWVPTLDESHLQEDRVDREAIQVEID